MVIIPNYRLSEPDRPTVQAPERNSAQSLRPTFTGWGPEDIMSRSSLVAMLIAVEIAIVGIAVYAVRGAHSLHNADFVAKTIAPIDAGASPRHRRRRRGFARRRRRVHRRARARQGSDQLARSVFRRSSQRSAARRQKDRRRRFDYAAGIERLQPSLPIRMVRAARRSRRSGRIARRHRALRRRRNQRSRRRRCRRIAGRAHRARRLDRHDQREKRRRIDIGVARSRR